MAVVAVIAAVAIGVGTVVKTIGDVAQTQAKAEEDRSKADKLEELSKPGGYYDQQLAAIQSDLTDVEASRAAAGKILAISSLEISQQGAQATGHITAAAGAGNLAQTGSVEQRKGLVTTQIQQNLARYRLQYEGQLRGLATRQAQDIASQTKVTFEQTSGLSDAEALRNEADWLNTWGIGLTIAGDIMGGVAGIAGGMSSFLGGKQKQPGPEAGLWV